MAVGDCNKSNSRFVLGLHPASTHEVGSGHKTIHNVVECESCAGMCVGGIHLSTQLYMVNKCCAIMYGRAWNLQFVL